jgi:putative transposase
MPRKPRFYLPNMPVHIWQRGNNRQEIFFAESDYHAYLTWLHQGATRYGCAIHAYVLMPNHVHCLITPETTNGVGQMMQFVGRNYVSYINRTYDRSGTLWEGRYKSCLVNPAQYGLACYRYLETNPVRSKLVATPGDYRWSSYPANALGKHQDKLSPLNTYNALGNTAADRQQAYQALISQVQNAREMDMIQRSVQTGTPLGDEQYQAELAKKLGCPVGYSKRGRPRKHP